MAKTIAERIEEQYPPEQRGDEWREFPCVDGGGAHVEPTQRRLITAADVATIDDLVRAGSEVRWLWPGWIPVGVLTALAGEGGKGKTRFCADLMRRIRHGLTWPDGTAIQAPRDGLWLWVMSDNHHDEIVTLAQAFDIAPNFRFNASRTDPYGGVTLETADDLADLDGRIRATQPAVVVVDTVGNATDKNLSKQEDAKAFYSPLQILARRHRCAFLCLTHLNAGGTFLGRRVMEKVRVALRMLHPEGQERRRIEVYKTNSKKPEALGMTMNDDGNEYDDKPPEMTVDEPGKKGRPNAKATECKDWLKETLEKKGPCRHSVLRNDAELVKGFSTSVFYSAVRLLGLEEYEGHDGKKWYRLPYEGEDVIPINDFDGNPFT